MISILCEKNLIALIAILVTLITEIITLLTILFKYLFNRKENKILDILIRYLDIQKQFYNTSKSLPEDYDEYDNTDYIDDYDEDIDEKNL